MTRKILLVDDEPNVLQGFKRHLRKDYELSLAVGGHAALKEIEDNGPFAVVVSDMQMPEMSGVELLSEIESMNTHTVRVMLTGNADQKTAVDAVNDGKIFRFLNKPCPPETLAKVLDAGLEHYRMLTAEAELLDKTLSGSVLMLTQVLSLVLPEAFGLTQEARRWARAIAVRFRIEPLWEVEMAAMLMRVGCVSLPSRALSAYLSGKTVSGENAALIADTPKLGHGLLSAIPRLEGVANIILAQNGPPFDPTPLPSRIIRVIGDYQRFFRNNPAEAFGKLANSSVYDPRVVKALSAAMAESSSCHDVTVDELRDGMILAVGVQDQAGRLLVAGGLEVHEAMRQKLMMFDGVKEPIKVRITTDEEGIDDAATAAAEVAQSIFE